MEARFLAAKNDFTSSATFHTDLYPQLLGQVSQVDLDVGDFVGDGLFGVAGQVAGFLPVQFGFRAFSVERFDGTVTRVRS